MVLERGTLEEHLGCSSANTPPRPATLLWWPGRRAPMPQTWNSMTSGLIWNFSESSQSSSQVNRLVPRNPSLGRCDFSCQKKFPSPFRRRTSPFLFPATLIAGNFSHVLRRRRFLFSAASLQGEATSPQTGAALRSLPGPVVLHLQAQISPFSPGWAELLRHTSESLACSGPAGASPPDPERSRPNTPLSLSLPRPVILPHETDGSGSM